MSIRDISLSPRQPEHLTNKSVKETQTNAAGDAKRQAQAAATPEAAQDRVEISEAGRKALAGGANATGELDVARKALSEAAPLSEERIAQIRTRLESGYYQGKEASEAVAAGLAATILGTDEA